MCDRFRERGYCNKIVQNCRDKVGDRDRQSLLTPKPGPSAKESRIVCATTFSPISHDIKSSVQKHWHILSSDPSIGHSFKCPPIFANRRSDNLRNVLVRADCYTPPTNFLSTLPGGNFTCASCAQCNAMIKGDTFCHPHTGKTFFIKDRISCRTKHIVYLLKCPCGLSYVGKTTRELRTRISEHKSSIRNKDMKSPVARHFNSAGHDVCTLKFQGIEFVPPPKRGGNRDKILLQREARWIHLLQTESPKGLNEELILSCFL